MIRVKRPRAYLYRYGDNWKIQHLKKLEFQHTYSSREEAEYMAKHFHGWQLTRYKPWDNPRGK